MIKPYICFFFLCFPLALNARNLSQETANRFILALAAESESAADFVLPEELALSQRLGISYQGIRPGRKFLIGYDLAPQVKTGIREGTLEYEARIEKLDQDFSLLELKVPELEYRRSYYFKQDRLVSPVYYFTRDWKRQEGRYFRFYISDTTRFNSYSAARLESFLDSALKKLEFSQQEKEKLQTDGLIYVFCADPGEIERLTGVHTRGMNVLAYDYVVTTFNCHYHELLHLLINYKLGHLPLYTHSFLQEGFAVALGGRGGKEPGVILDLGYFLERSGFLDYRELLDQKNFDAQDPSISYPLSGLYNCFLLEELSLDGYLALYRKYSGTAASVSGLAIEESDLPEPERWKDFLDNYNQYENVYLEGPPESPELLRQAAGASVYQAGDSYFFRMKDVLLIGPEGAAESYRSGRFSQLVPEDVYLGAKYLILASPAEVGVYNLLTDNLTANFVCEFSLTVESVTVNEGFFEFYVRKTVFDEPLEGMQIKCLQKD